MSPAYNTGVMVNTSAVPGANQQYYDQLMQLPSRDLFAGVVQSGYLPVGGYWFTPAELAKALQPAGATSAADWMSQNQTALLLAAAGVVFVVLMAKR